MNTLILGVALMVPMLWAALGETVVEQAGVLNVGIEGVMLIGAFGAAIGVNYGGGSIYVGLLVAIGCGFLSGVMLSLLYVRLGTDQIVTGILFNVFAFGLTTTLAQKYVQAGVVTSLPKVKVPGLEAIPWIGKIFFQQDVLVYGAYVAAPIVFYLVRSTWFGLYARSASEYPRAAEAAGLSVWGLRYVAVILGCGLTAVGGTVLFSTSGGFVSGLTNGRGFIALAVVVLARWNPFAVVGASLLFGVAQALQFANISWLQHVPLHLVVAFPYAVTIAAVVFARGSRYPAAVGVPYRPSAKAS